MSTRTSHNSEASLFYITFTCFQWLPLFELCNGYDLVYKWFEYLKEKYDIKTTAYTIMPNHVHCILFFPTNNYDLNKIVGNGKRFIAYELIKRLQEKGLSKILLQLKEGLTERDVTKGQKHKVFEDSFDAEADLSPKISFAKDKLHPSELCSWQMEVSGTLGRLRV